MDTNYTERQFSAGITMILGAFTALMLFWLVYQLVHGPVGSRPAPDWVLGVLTGFFLLVTLNFSFLRISADEKGIRIGYGILTTYRSWDRIASCEPDEKKHFYGWGIRFGKYKGEWVWVYNKMGGARVVLLTGEKKPRGLIVTSSQPEELLAFIRKHIRQ